MISVNGDAAASRSLMTLQEKVVPRSSYSLVLSQLLTAYSTRASHTYYRRWSSPSASGLAKHRAVL